MPRPINFAPLHAASTHYSGTQTGRFSSTGLLVAEMNKLKIHARRLEVQTGATSEVAILARESYKLAIAAVMTRSAQSLARGPWPIKMPKVDKVSRTARRRRNISRMQDSIVRRNVQLNVRSGLVSAGLSREGSPYDAR